VLRQAHWAIVLNYVIDAQDRITSINGAWTRFAESNKAPDLTPERVVGRPIWQFIADAHTRHLYELVFTQVRAGAPAATLPFRCDAPGLIRHMQLVISSAGRGALHLESSMEATVEREPNWLLDSDHPRLDEMLRICSWCKNIDLGSNGWVSADRGIREFNVFTREAAPRLSHGICPDCADHVCSEFGLAAKD
jgi:hypothetical protein